MFKYVDIKVITRVCNEDNLKVCRLTATYSKPGSVTNVEMKEDNTVEVTFTTMRSLVKNFKHDLAVLNLVGIKGKVAAL